MNTAFRLVCLIAGAVAATPAFAQSEIFLCTDADGRKTYQNTGTAKNCKRVDMQPIMSVPAARLPVRPGEGGSNSNPNNNSSASSERRAASPANFPRVDGDAQRARDSDRRRILEDELRVEEQRLSQLKSEFNNGEPERKGDERNFARYQERVQRLQEDVQRAEANVASLRRELQLLRQ